MAEFDGTYTLVENCNMRAFAEATFPSKIACVNSRLIPSRNLLIVQTFGSEIIKIYCI